MTERDGAPRPYSIASRLEQRAPHLFVGELTEDWYQGRAAVGGLTAALLARAMEVDAAEGRPLRTLHTTFCAPATAGEIELRTEIVRSGRSVAFVRAKMERAGEPIAMATATFARERRSSAQSFAPPPLGLPPVEAVEDGPEVLYIPDFCRYLEFRQAIGQPAFSGSEEAYVGGWCRLREGPVTAEAAMVPLLMDAWAPAALSRHPRWAPCASIEMFIQLHAVLRDVELDWVGYEARSEHLDGGYADEQSALYFADGRPIATARQLIAIFD